MEQPIRGALGLSQLGLFQLNQALAAESSPPLIWLHGSSCSGCSIAALNAVAPTNFGDLLLNRVSVKYDGLLMAAGADLAIRTMDLAAQANDGRFILIVEGGVPTAERGRYCIIGERAGEPITLLDAVNQLGPRAARVLAVGTCAAYKGVAGAGDNITGVASLSDVLAGKLARPVINVPGCPAPPEQLFAIVVGLLAGGQYALDVDGRPATCFPHTVHATCPRKHLAKATDSVSPAASSIWAAGERPPWRCARSTSGTTGRTGARRRATPASAARCRSSRRHL